MRVLWNMKSLSLKLLRKKGLALCKLVCKAEFEIHELSIKNSILATRNIFYCYNYNPTPRAV